MTRPLRCTAALLLCCVSAAAIANDSRVDQSVDARLMNNCAARTDARMDSMTQGKLEQIRNYEFSLRIAMAQLAGGSDAMSPSEWQRATAQLRTARVQLAQVCDIAVPAQG